MQWHLWALAFLPAILVALYARWRFSGAFKACTQLETEGQMTGAKTSRILLDRNGMANIELYETPYSLTDHFDSRRRCVFLSVPVAEKRSVAAVAIAAHVVAHAIQFKQDYRLFRLRMSLLSSMGWLTNFLLFWVVLGLLSEGTQKEFLLLGAGFVYLVFTAAILFTLRAETDANRRALRELLRHQIIQEAETKTINRMLSATAWLDMPGLLIAFFGLFRFFFARSNRRIED